MAYNNSVLTRSSRWPVHNDKKKSRTEQNTRLDYSVKTTPWFIEPFLTSFNSGELLTMNLCPFTKFPWMYKRCNCVTVNPFVNWYSYISDCVVVVNQPLARCSVGNSVVQILASCRTMLLLQMKSPVSVDALKETDTGRWGKWPGLHPLHQWRTSRRQHLKNASAKDTATVVIKVRYRLQISNKVSTKKQKIVLQDLRTEPHASHVCHINASWMWPPFPSLSNPEADILKEGLMRI